MTEMKAGIDDAHPAFRFNDEPQVVDLGDEVYVLFKNDYIGIMFDEQGEILTRDELAAVMDRYLRSKGKIFTPTVVDTEATDENDK